MCKLKQIMAGIILLLLLYSSLAHSKSLTARITILIDTAILNQVNLTFGRFYVQVDGNNKVTSVKFNVFVKGKGFWILKRDWLKMGGKVDGIIFLLKI